MDSVEPEFSVPILIDEIPAGGRVFSLEADAIALEGLARRFELASFTEFKGKIRVSPLAGGPLIKVAGSMHAVLAQACVVTLDPVPVDIEIAVEGDFGPPVEVPDDFELTLSDVEPHEEIVDGGIDLGELAAQQLYLALDPYPRAHGVAVAEVGDTDGGESSDEVENVDNPFAKLADLKARMKDGK